MEKEINKFLTFQGVKGSNLTSESRKKNSFLAHTAHTHRGHLRSYQESKINEIKSILNDILCSKTTKKHGKAQTFKTKMHDICRVCFRGRMRKSTLSMWFSHVSWNTPDVLRCLLLHKSHKRIGGRSGFDLCLQNSSVVLPAFPSPTCI